MPIAQIICYIDKENIDINDIYIEDLEKIYPEASSQYTNNKEFNELAKLINKQLNENEKELIEKWSKIKKISVDSIKRVLEMLHHEFDIWNGESDVNNLIPDMLINLKRRKKYL